MEGAIVGLGRERIALLPLFHRGFALVFGELVDLGVDLFALALHGFGLFDLPAHEHRDDREQGALDGTCREREERALPTEPAAREHDEEGVAHRHAGLPAEARVEEIEREPHDDEADARAEESVGDLETAERGGRNTEDGAADADRERDDHVLEVDECGRDHAEREGKRRRVDGARATEGELRLGVEKKLLGDGDAEDTADELDEGIARRETRAAARRFPAEEHVRQDGHVLPRTDGRLALGAMRGRSNDAHPARHAIDDDVQEAPEQEPERHGETEHDGGREEIERRIQRRLQHTASL